MYYKKSRRPYIPHLKMIVPGTPQAKRFTRKTNKRFLTPEQKEKIDEIKKRNWDAIKLEQEEIKTCYKIMPQDHPTDCKYLSETVLPFKYQEVATHDELEEHLSKIETLTEDQKNYVRYRWMLFKITHVDRRLLNSAGFKIVKIDDVPHFKIGKTCFDVRENFTKIPVLDEDENINEENVNSLCQYLWESMTEASRQTKNPRLYIIHQNDYTEKQSRVWMRVKSFPMKHKSFSEMRQQFHRLKMVDYNGLKMFFVFIHCHSNGFINTKVFYDASKPVYKTRGNSVRYKRQNTQKTHSFEKRAKIRSVPVE